MKSVLAHQHEAPPLLNLPALKEAPVAQEPYPHLIASGVVDTAWYPALEGDFPALAIPGFFSVGKLEREGTFDALLRELEGQELAEILSDKLALELRDKPRMITVRRWSAPKDGRIHNDSESKIATMLLYLNRQWDSADGGALRVLKGRQDFEDHAAEIPPLFGHAFAFRRTENSWHGHKPFTGERRVIQVTWLRSQKDLERKEKRGKTSYFLKTLLTMSGM